MDNLDKKRAEPNASEMPANAGAGLQTSPTRSQPIAREFNFTNQNPEEKFLVEMFSHITERLKQKYNYSDNEIFKLWNNEESVLIPVAIFTGKLSPAEALAKFLKENHGMTFHEIAELIGRNERSIWANYKRAAKKMPWPLEVTDSAVVPASIFNSEKSILEALVSYLKDAKKMRNRKIAQLLNKNQANIWTVANRAKKKENGNGHSIINNSKNEQ